MCTNRHTCFEWQHIICRDRKWNSATYWLPPPSKTHGHWPHIYMHWADWAHAMTHLGSMRTFFIYHWLSEQSASSHAISPNGFTDNYDMAVKKIPFQIEPLFLTQVFGRFQLNQEGVFDEKQNKSTWVCFRVSWIHWDTLEYMARACSIVKFYIFFFYFFSRQSLTSSSSVLVICTSSWLWVSACRSLVSKSFIATHTQTSPYFLHILILNLSFLFFKQKKTTVFILFKSGQSMQLSLAPCVLVWILEYGWQCQQNKINVTIHKTNTIKEE